MEQAGLHIVVCPRAAELNAEDRELMRRLRPVGIHLRVRNFVPDVPAPEWLEALTALLKDCRELSGRPRQLVVIDHEGGRVHRLPAPFTHFPWAVQWADRAEAVARAMAVELRALGVNLLLGPVADVASNPENPVIGPRAFSSSAAECARITPRFVSVAQSLGLACCLKHFPGHGDTHQDSHACLPRVDHAFERLRAIELPPFEAGIAAGCRSVMSAHLVNPELDPGCPATLSRKTLNGLLRETLGFSGIIFSDDMEMAAITGLPTGTPELEALAAGVDLLLYNHHPERALAAADAIDRARAEGRLDLKLERASAARIQTLLESLPAPGPSVLPSMSDLELNHALARECAHAMPLDLSGSGFEAL